jgi:hypothetical protein
MKLRTRLSLTALATAVAAGTAGAALLPAANAQPLTRTHNHTLAFTLVEQTQVQFSPTLSIAEDKDLNHAGKVIGYDVIRFCFDPKTTTAVIGVTIDLPGGFLYGQVYEGSSPVSHGTVSGGSGAYRGATGTITVKALDNDDDRAAVTIAYRTAG